MLIIGNFSVRIIRTVIVRIQLLIVAQVILERVSIFTRIISRIHIHIRIHIYIGISVAFDHYLGNFPAVNIVISADDFAGVQQIDCGGYQLQFL